MVLCAIAGYGSEHLRRRRASARYASQAWDGDGSWVDFRQHLAGRAAALYGRRVYKDYTLTELLAAAVRHAEGRRAAVGHERAYWEIKHKILTFLLSEARRHGETPRRAPAPGELADLARDHPRFRLPPRTGETESTVKERYLREIRAKVHRYLEGIAASPTGPIRGG